MFRQLLWKEWREQRWKLIFGIVMLVFFTGTLMATQLSTSREVLVAVWMLGGLVMALYSAMGVFAPEISNGTQIFLATKPIQPWKIFFGKWLIGWLNFTVPMLVCSVGLAIINLTRPEGQLFDLQYITRGTFAGLGFGTMLYTMTCCFAPRKSGEAMAGLTGLIVGLVFFAHMGIIEMTIRPWNKPFPVLYELISFLNPIMWINFIQPISSNIHLWLLAIEQFILFGLTIVYGYRKWKRS
jgi:ABC-type transport system involved in multi-copper enzyme maturation permease subunit